MRAPTPGACESPAHVCALRAHARAVPRPHQLTRPPTLLLWACWVGLSGCLAASRPRAQRNDHAARAPRRAPPRQLTRSPLFVASLGWGPEGDVSEGLGSEGEGLLS